MKIPTLQNQGVKPRAATPDYDRLSFNDGTDTLVQGLGRLSQGVNDVQQVNAERAAKAKEKADAAAVDSLYAQAQDATTRELHGYDEAPESKPEGTTSIDTLTVEDLATAGGPGKHVPGYLDSRGHEAYEKAGDVTTRLKKRYDELLGLAGNETQRAMLTKGLERLKGSVQLQVANHEGAQLRVAEQAASKALLDTTLRTAANLFDKPDELAPFVAEALGSIKRTSLPEEYEAKSTEFLANVSKARIGKFIAAGRLEAAEEQLATDVKVLGDDAPKLQELLTTKKKAAAKDAAELTTQAVMDRKVRTLANPYGFLAEADLNQLRDEASARYPEDKEEAKRTAEQWISIERAKKAAVVGSWITEARIHRRRGGTKAIPAELVARLEEYGEDQGLDFLERIAEDDRRKWEHAEARARSGAAKKEADRRQKYLNELALTRMKALPWEEQADFAKRVGFEGLGVDELGQAKLEEQQRKAINYQTKGFGSAKEKLDSEIEDVANAKALKGEDPGSIFDIKADAAGELELFIEKNQRAPDANERNAIISRAALRQATKPRILDSIRGPGMEFPFQQEKREGAAALNPRDQQAADWARANPGDPRAAAILKKLGAR